MAVVLFDNARRKNLCPLAYTCAIADLRMGIFTIKERWENLLNEEVFIYTENYLQPLYRKFPEGMHLWIDASVICDDALPHRMISLEDNIAIADSRGLVAGKKNIEASKFSPDASLELFETVFEIEDVIRLQYPWQIFQWNDEMLRKDFSVIIKKNISQKISPANKVIAPENIFIEEGAVVEHALLNASTGPIYIGKNAVIMEGALIRGPFAALEKSIVKMGAKIYGATTLGPFCTAGGEIKNTVMQGFSNKAHDGYLGDSVIGKWCNLGAGTSNSNLKNNAGDIKFSFGDESETVTAGNKCGVTMGDYSRTAINTSINTGTTIGVGCNVFGEGFTPKNIPNFMWGAKGITKYEFEKAVKDIARWKEMKQQFLSVEEISVLKYIFEQL